MSFTLGLTGSIGMGKSTTAQLFAEKDCAVWDADAAVHRLYAQGGAAVEPVGRTFPSAVVEKAVSRDRLKAMIAKDSSILEALEQIVHPLVAADRATFIDEADTDIVVLDIPLLFETGADQNMDAVVVVTAPADVQRKRVMQRATITENAFELILAKQMPDAEKRARADYVVITDTVEHAREQVQDILKDIRTGIGHA